MIKVGITGTGSLIGQAIIKCMMQSSLKEELYKVGFDYFSGTIGSFWTEENELLPDILKKDVSPEIWVNALMNYIQKHSIQFLFCGVDFELKILAKYKGEIEKQTGCKVLVSDTKVIEIADDKYLTYQFLKENGLSCPKTFLANEINYDGIELPCIVKPRIGARSIGVYKVNTLSDLQEKMQIEGNVAQEMVGNDKTEYTCGAVFLNDKIDYMVILRRDLRDGNTANAYFEPNTPPQIQTYLEKVVLALKPYGSCNFQLRLDKDGIPKLFEINSRHSGTTYMRALFGYNEVEYILNELLGREKIVFSPKYGTVKRFFDEMYIPL